MCKKKKIIAFAMVAVLLATSTNQSKAYDGNDLFNLEYVEDGSDLDEINDLLEELSETIADSLVENKDCTVKIEEINDSLERLGVEEIQASDYYDITDEIAESKISIEKPKDKPYTRFFMKTIKNRQYGSQKYDVNVLYALGQNNGGQLVTGRDNEEFYSNTTKALNNVLYFVSLYAQKAIGNIKLIGWTPYELAFQNKTKDVANSNYVTHRCVSTIEFTYVKKSNYADDAWRLTRNSNHLSIAFNTHGAGINGSKPFTYSKNTTESISSDNYGNLDDAIKNYSNGVSYYDYIPFYTIYSHDKKYSSRMYVENPVGPGAIYS